VGERIVFTIAAASALASGTLVVTLKGPFRATVALIGTLLSVAVLFLLLAAPFVAAIQVIVYAGAIVVLFLFVLMLLGVDQAEDLSVEPLGGGQRIAAVLIGLAILALPLFAFWSTEGDATGAPAAEGAPDMIDGGVADIAQLGESLFTTYLFAFEVTSVLLVIAVVGAVVMARKVKRADLIEDPLVVAHEAELAAAADEVDSEAEAPPEGDAEAETLETSS